jgi:hypothetical protein
MNKRNFAILMLIFLLGLNACGQQTEITPSMDLTPIPATTTQTSGKELEDQTTPSPAATQQTPIAPPSKGEGGLSGTGTSILEWERTGGIAGICQTMAINQDFSYQILNCATGKEIASGELTSEQAGYVEDLQNRYPSFQWHFNPPKGSADMFMDRYTLFGTGSMTPAPEVQAAIDQDLANLANELTNPNSPTPSS